MKRLHVHVGVEDLDKSIDFYSELFAAPPSKQRDDYAKWMLEDPRVNFAISRRADVGVGHLGIQVEDANELAEVYGRLRRADTAIVDEGETTCCYARSHKQWVADPQGVVWETFLTIGEEVDYGRGPDLAAMRDNS